MRESGRSPYHDYDAWTGLAFLVWYDNPDGQSPAGDAGEQNPAIDAGDAGEQTSGGGVGLGALYHPEQDSWTTTSPAGAPSRRKYASHLWAGDRLLVWGGRDPAGQTTDCQDGHVYLAGSDTWQSMSVMGSPAGCRMLMSIVWTGSLVVAWGGETPRLEPSDEEVQFDDGARYEPEGDVWRPMSHDGAPSKRLRPVTLWTGSRMIVWAGCQNAKVSSPCYNDGALYDPSSDTWSPMSGEGAPLARIDPASVWTGTEMVVWGGRRCGDGGDTCDDGFAYNPETNRWRGLSLGSPSGSAAVPSSRRAAWTGRYMFVAGGPTEGAIYYHENAGLYNPEDDTWHNVATIFPSADQPYDYFRDPAVVWTGKEVIVWGVDAAEAPPKDETRSDSSSPNQPPPHARYTPP